MLRTPDVGWEHDKNRWGSFISTLWFNRFNDLISWSIQSWAKIEGNHKYTACRNFLTLLSPHKQCIYWCAALYSQLFIYEWNSLFVINKNTNNIFMLYKLWGSGQIFLSKLAYLRNCFIRCFILRRSCWVCCASCLVIEVRCVACVMLSGQHCRVWGCMQVS